ncbi:hypothetical protein EHS13_14710 [Paenibacillus psychroresistens]|uniref:Phytanoyl-CoA dioxygenase n=1 Tax=Paenibacillus psychroresistens TaxID=1778678 RepID=A0A6B8RJ16_9BACL|nr:phytanoyl-CoA dioxygenase family protein [Paenibacillus psychroresistens]QGQ96039.1 hypothetical protein EHS13_14710 [Paenibacillus psychroresistens]
MSNVEKSHLLTAEQMASFAVNGYIQLADLVPKEMNDAAHADQIKWAGRGHYWQESSVIREIFELPQVKGVLQSLVGQAPVYDHSALHIVRPQHHKAQEYHADSVIDTRQFGFDIQAFYFSHDTPAIMGPTLILPGSHLHNKVNTSSIGRYKNIIGQRKLESKAGTIGFLHQNIWHCAQPNYTDETRYVFKLRLRPGQEQRSLFNTDEYNGPEVAKIFRSMHAWAGNDSRVNQIAAAKFYRFLCGDDRVDFSFEGVLSRMGL